MASISPAVFYIRSHNICYEFNFMLLSNVDVSFEEMCGNLEAHSTSSASV